MALPLHAPAAHFGVILRENGEHKLQRGDDSGSQVGPLASAEDE